VLIKGSLRSRELPGEKTGSRQAVQKNLPVSPQGGLERNSTRLSFGDGRNVLRAYNRGEVEKSRCSPWAPQFYIEGPGRIRRTAPHSQLLAHQRGRRGVVLSVQVLC
jgi:hypothetical protein